MAGLINSSHNAPGWGSGMALGLFSPATEVGNKKKACSVCSDTAEVVTVTFL